MGESRLVCLFVGFLVLLACSITSQPLLEAMDSEPDRESRVPLTFANAGLYGGWHDDHVSADSPFDYLIIQALVFDDRIEWNGKNVDDAATWNDWLKRARAAGKRVIADVVPAAYDEAGNVQTIQSMYHNRPPLPLETFLPLFDKFFNEVDEQQLYAITLSEEHVHWNGHADRLNAMYDYVKSRYDVPVYQWYTPGAWAAGFSEWPNLKADGWVSDEYFLAYPQIDQYFRSYMIQRKPLLHIVWATPAMPTSVPWRHETFDAQLAACEKYGIAPSFFTWAGPGSGKWGWMTESPEATRGVFVNEVLPAVKRCSESHASVDFASWDESLTPPPWIMLRCDPDGRPRMNYRDDFVQPSHVKVLRDAAFTGFADLKWDSSPLQLCPRQVGTANSTITWQFESPLPMQTLRVIVPGMGGGGRDSSIMVSVSDEAGELVGHVEMDHGAAAVVEVTRPSFRKFAVTATLTGTASKADEVVAQIDGIEIDAMIAPTNRDKPIRLDIDNRGDAVYADDLRNLTILHTAHNIIRRTSLTLAPGWLYASGLDGMNYGATVIQQFRSEKPMRIDMLWIKGRASETIDQARFGIGVSSNGQNMLAESWSKGDAEGMVTLDVGELEDFRPGVTEFFVHLLLEANGKRSLPERVGVSGYGLRGRVVATE